MCLFLAQLEQTITLVDKAAQASDRWLFLFLLALVLSGGLIIIRKLVRTIEIQSTNHSEFVLKVYTESVKVQAQLVVALQENNVLIGRVKSFMDHWDDSRNKN